MWHRNPKGTKGRRRIDNWTPLVVGGYEVTCEFDRPEYNSDYARAVHQAIKRQALPMFPVTHTSSLDTTVFCMPQHLIQVVRMAESSAMEFGPVSDLTIRVHAVVED